MSCVNSCLAFSASRNVHYFLSHRENILKFIFTSFFLFFFCVHTYAGTITVSETESSDGQYRVSWSGINTVMGTPQLFESGSSLGSISGSGYRDFTKIANGSFSYSIQEYVCMMGGCSVMGTVGPKQVTVTLADPAPPTATINLFPANTVGGMSFSASVTGKGDAVVSVPLELIPGVNGHEPTLGIRYGSNHFREIIEKDKTAEASIGSGWSIRGGVSLLHGCSKRIPNPVQNSWNDFELTNLCLDGEPLLLVPAVDQVDGYEINEFDPNGVQYVLWNSPDVRVIRFQTLSGSKYTVYYPDGRVAEYGHNSNSKMEWIAGPQFVASIHALNKMTDAFGNTIEYDYYELFSQKMYLPKQIRYGNNGDAVIDFEYEDSNTVDSLNQNTPITGGHYGSTYLSTLRPVPVPHVVNKIKMSLNNQVVREYRLRSETVNNSWTRLTDIQQCGYTALGSMQCLQPINVQWQQGGAIRYKTRVASVDNGQGNRAEFVYTDMTENGSEANFSERPFGEASLPAYTVETEAQDSTNVLQTVVTSIRKSNGVGGMRTWSYAYQGRGVKSHDDFNWGFLGFYSQRIKDEATGIYSYTQYSLKARLKNRSSASLSTLGQYGQAGTQVLNKTFQRFELASVYHGKHKQYNGFTEIVKPMRTNDAYVSESLSMSYEQGQLVKATVNNAAPSYVSGSDNNTGIWIPGGGPTATLEYPLQSMTSTTRYLDPSSLQNPSASGWGVYQAFSYSTVLRSNKTTVFLTENRLISDYFVGFAHRVESRIYDGDTNTSPVQTTVSTASPLVTANGKTTLRKASSTAFDGVPLLETTTNKQFNASGILTSTEVRNSSNVLLNQSTSANIVAGRFSQSLTNALGHLSSVSYDVRIGAQTSVTDPNGLVAQQRYDGLGRITEIETPDGVTVATTRESCALVSCPTLSYGGGSVVPTIVITQSSPILPTTSVYVDSLGRTLREASESIDGQNVYVDTHYNALGQTVATSLPYFAGSSPEYATYQYDNLGRVVQASSPSGGSVVTQYTVSNGKMVTTTTENVVDNLGQFVESHVKRIENNYFGEVEKSIDAYGDTLLESKTEFEYYATGLARNINVNGQWAADFEYDVAGNRIRLHDQSAGIELSSYNGAGQTTQVTDAAGNITTYDYDLLGRMTKETTGDGTQNWVYDPVNSKGGLSYVEFVDNNSGYYHKQSIQYRTDSKPQTSVTQIRVPGLAVRNYQQSFTYDTHGRTKMLTYPSGASSINHYDARGFVSSVTDGSGNTLHSVATVDATGNITQANYGNGLSTAKVYDPKSGALTSIISSVGSTQLQNNAMKWRSDGFLESRHNTLNGSKDESFTYDSLGRLRTSTTLSGGNTRTAETQYFLNGNIKSKTASNTGGKNEDQVMAYQYGSTSNAGPNAVSQVRINGVNNTLHYDSKGAVTRYDAVTGPDKFIDWTKRGKPWRITKGVSATASAPEARDEFAYGVGGFRYYRKATWQNASNQQQTEHTFYIGGYEDVIPGNDPAYNRVERTYLTGKAMHIRTTPHVGAATSKLEFLHKDHLGSVEAITDVNGNVLAQMSFDTFGSRRNPNWVGLLSEQDTEQLLSQVGVVTSRGYTGHEHLDRTGIVHMNGRVFDPVLSRFLSPDPLVQAPYFSQSYNRYTYTFNNPLMFTDPSGYGSSCGVGCTSYTFVDGMMVVVNGGRAANFDVQGFVSSYSGGGGFGSGGGSGSGYAETADGRFVRVPVGQDGYVPDYASDGSGHAFEGSWTLTRGGRAFGNVAPGGRVTFSGSAGHMGGYGQKGSVAGAAISNTAIANTTIGLGAGLVEASKVQWLKPKSGQYFYWGNPALNTVNIGIPKNSSQVLVNTKGALALAGKVTLVGGVVLETSQAMVNIRQGSQPTAEILKTTLDVEMGISAAFFPVGTAVSAGYFVMDSFVGWETLSGDSPSLVSSSGSTTNF